MDKDTFDLNELLGAVGEIIEKIDEETVEKLKVVVSQKETQELLLELLGSQQNNIDLEDIAAILNLLRKKD